MTHQDAVRLFDAVEFVGLIDCRSYQRCWRPTSRLKCIEISWSVEDIAKQELDGKLGILNYTRNQWNKSLRVTPCGLKLLEDNLEAVYNAVAAVSPLAVELFFDKETIAALVRGKVITFPSPPLVSRSGLL